MKLATHLKINWQLAFPVMLSQVGHILVGVADSIMVGRIGPEPLAAAALASSIFLVLMTVGIGISYGLTPLVGAADGKGDRQQVTDTLKHGLLICVLTGCLLTALQLLSVPLLPLMGQPVEVVALAAPYLSILAFSLIPIMLFQAGRQFAEGLSLTRMAMVVTVGGNLLNVGLNYLLIYGEWGFPRLELNGAGYASLISRVVIAGAMTAYIFYGAPFTSYRAGFAVGRYSRLLHRRILGIGIPAGAQYLFETTAFGVSAIMMGWLGTTALAAHQIALNMAAITYMVTSGLAAAATIRVSNLLGRSDFATMRQAGLSLIGSAAAFMSVAACLFIAGRFFLPSLYVSDEDVLQLAASLMIIAALFQIGDGTQLVSIGALRGLKDVKIPMIYVLIAHWFIGLPAGYLLAFTFGLGAPGIWWGLFLGLSVTSGLACVRFLKLSAAVEVPEPRRLV